MAKLSIGFGVVLILLGIGGFMATGKLYPTALIPTWFGLALAVAGSLALTQNVKRRKLWMHTAAGLGVLGFLGAAIRAIIVIVEAHGALTQFFDVGITPGDGGLITHSLSTALIGKDGRVRAWYPTNEWTPAEVLAAMKSAAAA